MELWRKLLFLLRRGQFDRELDEEMQFHLEMKARKNREAGAPEDEAAYAARRKFGNALALRERSRDAWGWAWLDTIMQDVRYAVRGLRRNPAFTAVAVVTLALGIGANTAVFSVVHAVLLKPLPFRDPDRLVMVWENWKKYNLGPRTNVSSANYHDWEEQSRSFESMGAIAGGLSTMTISGEPVEMPGVGVTRSFFDVLGVEPAQGRAFLPEEERRGGRAIAILGNGLWRRMGSPNLAGGTVPLNREPHAMAGIMPPGFDFPDNSEVWLPLTDEWLSRADRGNHSFRVVARLRPGVSVAQAQTEMNTIAARLAKAYPDANQDSGVTIVPLREQIVGEARRSVLVLYGVVACVLLIACANVANLLLARAAGRGREIAMRRALGASRWRVARFVLTESLLLSLGGGAAGLVLAWWGVRTFVVSDPIKLPLVRLVSVNGTVLLFTTAVAVLTGVLFGILPALRLSRIELHAPGATARDRGRSVLAAAQIAAAVVLLVGAGLFLRSFLWRISMPLGFQPEGLLAVELPWGAHRQLDDVLERIRVLPGVRAVGASTAFPHQPANTSGGFTIESRPAVPGEFLRAGKLPATPGYFRAAGISLRKGRLIADSDTAVAPPVVVVNETLARRYFPDRNPLGGRINCGGDEPWREIVGVVTDAKGLDLEGEPMPAIYVPYKQYSWTNPVYILVRTDLPPAVLASPVRKVIRSWKKDILIPRLATMENMLAESVAVPRFYMLLVAAFAAVALAVAAVGVYGAINYSVAQRTHEIGIRMALGAQRGDVLAMIVGRGLVLTLAGAAIGLAGAWASTRVLASLLFGIRPGDAIAFAGAGAVLILVALLACYVPARRAAKIHPMEALRYE